MFHKATSINEVIEQQINIGVDVNDEWLEQGIQDVIKHMTFTKLMTKYYKCQHQYVHFRSFKDVQNYSFSEVK